MTSDLISRQAAIKAIEDLQDCYNGFSDTYDKACIIGVIEEVPPIEPIKHGRWIKRGDNSWECSVCHEISCCNGNYCVDCGARMDEVENNTETLEAWNLDGSPTRYIKGKRMDESPEPDYTITCADAPMTYTCDRSVCMRNEYNDVDCDKCEVKR